MRTVSARLFCIGMFALMSCAAADAQTLFTNVRVHSYSQICDAVILPDAEIGRHARLSRVVIDGGVRIPAGLVVGEDPRLDARRFHRTEGGVTLITQSMVDALG